MSGDMRGATVSLEYVHVYGDIRVSDREAELRSSCISAMSKKSQLLNAGASRVTTCCLIDNYNRPHVDDPYSAVLDGTHNPLDVGYREVYVGLAGELNTRLAEIGMAPDFYMLEKDFAILARHYQSIFTPTGQEANEWFDPEDDCPQSIYLESRSYDLRRLTRGRPKKSTKEYMRARRSGQAIRPAYVGLEVLLWDGTKYSCPLLAAMWYAARFERSAPALEALAGDDDAWRSLPIVFSEQAPSFTASHLVNVLGAQYIAIEAAARYLSSLTEWGNALTKRLTYEFT